MKEIYDLEWYKYSDTTKSPPKVTHIRYVSVTFLNWLSYAEPDIMLLSSSDHTIITWWYLLQHPMKQRGSRAFISVIDPASIPIVLSKLYSLTTISNTQPLISIPWRLKQDRCYSISNSRVDIAHLQVFLCLMLEKYLHSLQTFPHFTYLFCLCNFVWLGLWFGCLRLLTCG